MQALSECLAPWAEGPLLWPAALYITGLHADQFPAEFHADRARLHHKPQPTTQQVRQSGLKYASEMATQMARIENLLAHGDDYLLGPKPTLADLTVYGAPWLLEKVGGTNAVIDKLPRTRTWLSRVANIGHGEHNSLSSEQALELANNSKPQVIENESYVPDGLRLGETVKVSPRDENSPAIGTLLAINAWQITLRVENERVNSVNVHFPRIGYRVSVIKR